MCRLRIKFCLLLGAALLGGCSDRDAPTAPVAGSLAAPQSGADHSSYTWNLSCSGDGASGANWYWTKVGTVIGTQVSVTCWFSGSTGGADARPADADGFVASVNGASQAWTVVPGTAFSAQLKGTYTWLDIQCSFLGRGGDGKCKRSATGTLKIDS